MNMATDTDAAILPPAVVAPEQEQEAVEQDSQPPVPTKATSNGMLIAARALEVFRGRTDVVPEKWATKDGKKGGYSPICKNKWAPGKCALKEGGRCSKCEHQEHAGLDFDLMYKHVAGKTTIGVYPLLTDNTCHFVALDLDNHDGKRDPLADVLALDAVRDTMDLPPFGVFRSRSGKGYHVYMFFKDPLPAWKPRTVFYFLAEEAQILEEDEDKEVSFDRFLPNQDEHSGKGFGNLIALPYQGGPAKQQHTLMLTPESGFTIPYNPQIAALNSIVYTTEAQLDALIAEYDLKPLGSGSAKKPESTSGPSNYQAGGPGDGTADAEKVLARCAFMRHCRDDAATLQEGQWFAMVSNMARCADGMAVVHRLSEPYPGYNRDETEEKARHAIQDSGPITCAHIKNTTRGKYCGECQETCKSPIVLGRARNEVAEAIEEMNQEHAVVWLGGKLRILRQNIIDNTFDFVSVYDFKQFYANQKYDVEVKVNGKVTIKTVDIANIWMASKHRKDYKGGVVFDPSDRCGGDCLNLYKGFTCEPIPGDWSLMRQHVLEVVCGGNVEYFAYLMAWCARMFQDPGGTRPGVAVVMRGGKGAGKGIFINALGDILGQHFLPVANVGQITGRFNSHLAQAILLFADEAFFAGDKRQEGPLKALITEDHITFEKKGVDSVKMRCHVNIIMASNEEWVVPASGDERRFFVLDTKNDRQEDHPYFEAIVAQMESGGQEAMLHDMLQYDYKSINLRKPPVTDALITQKTYSLPDVDEFWVECLMRGYIVSEQNSDRSINYDAEWEGSASMAFPLYKAQMYDEFKFWCKTGSKRYVASFTHFCSVSFGKNGLFRRGKSFIEEHPRNGRGIKFNTLEVCKADVIKKYGDMFKQAGGDEDESVPF